MILHKPEHFRIFMRLSLEQLVFIAGYFHLQTTEYPTKMAQICKVQLIAYFTRSSEINSLSAPVNQRRGDKDVEKNPHILL